MPEVSELKKQYSEYTSEYLLQMRAKGDLLVPEAHRAIEEILCERDEFVPPVPSKPVLLEGKDLDLVSPRKPEPVHMRILRVLGVLFLVLLIIAFGKALAHTWFGVIVATLFGAYYVVRWIQRESMSTEEKAKEQEREKIANEHLTEMMICAADGNLSRIKELVQYGANVNVASIKGLHR